MRAADSTVYERPTASQGGARPRRHRLGREHGIDSVIDETADQLADAKLVKVKFLRAARGGTTTDELAAELADAVNADLIETRGNTAVLH